MSYYALTRRSLASSHHGVCQLVSLAEFSSPECTAPSDGATGKGVWGVRTPPLFENMGLVISPNLQTRAYGARERLPVSPVSQCTSPPPNTWLRHWPPQGFSTATTAPAPICYHTAGKSYC